ncbi:MAG: LuxR C-terminal-related transcriptional regulator, partial [Sandaracinobacteroides sp.]
GNLSRARALFEGAFATSVEVVGRTNPTTAMPALHLSEVLYEIDEVDAARALVDEFLPLAGQTGLVDQLVAGYQTRVRLAALDSLPAALRALDEGEEIAIARDFPRLQAYLVASRIAILSAAGEAAEVRRIGTLNHLTTDIERFHPARGMTTAAAARAYAAAHVALTENNLAGAESLLSRWVRHLSDHGFLRLGVRFAMLLAHLHIMTGDTKAAHRSLRTALQFGSKGGATRSFLDSNRAVRAQIVQMQFAANGADLEMAECHGRILTALGGAKTRIHLPPADMDELGGRYEALNDRESELLLLIATGLMNSQIADQTGLTLGTVKWYLQQIYAKLGVNRRSEAVFKARQLGIIG